MFMLQLFVKCLLHAAEIFPTFWYQTTRVTFLDPSPPSPPSTNSFFIQNKYQTVFIILSSTFPHNSYLNTWPLCGNFWSIFRSQSKVFKWWISDWRYLDLSIVNKCIWSIQDPKDILPLTILINQQPDQLWKKVEFKC